MNNTNTQEKQNAQSYKSEKMRNMPIAKLLITMSLPAMISMLVQALYNIMDTIYVGMYYSGISESAYISATQALSVAFPMQMIILSVGIGIGVGANACISRKLGAGYRDSASKTASHALILALTAALVMVAVGLLVSKPFITGLSDVSGDGGDSLSTIEYGTSYLTIVSAFSFFSICELTGARILQSTGNMKIPMISQAVGAVVNIALDPIFLFAFNMGVSGAAWATVISQGCAFCITLSVLCFTKQDIKVSYKKFKFGFGYMKEIINVGLPAFVLNAIGAITYICLMLIMKGYVLGGVTQQVLGLYFRLNSIAFMPVFGLMQGLLPILGFSYGSRNKKRYTDCLRLSMLLSFGFLTLGCVLFETVPEGLLTLFSAGAATIEAGRPALRIIAIAFPFAAIGINVINAFQSLQCGVRSLLMSLFRQIGIIVPIALIFGQFGAWGIWMAYPIAEVFSVVTFAPMLKKTIRTKFDSVEKPAALAV